MCALARLHDLETFRYVSSEWASRSMSLDL